MKQKWSSTDMYDKIKQTGVLCICDRCGKFMESSTDDIYHVELWCHPSSWAAVHHMLLCPDCAKIYTIN